MAATNANALPFPFGQELPCQRSSWPSSTKTADSSGTASVGVLVSSIAARDRFLCDWVDRWIAGLLSGWVGFAAADFVHGHPGQEFAAARNWNSDDKGVEKLSLAI